MDVSELISKVYLLSEPNTAPEPFIKAFKGLSPRLQGNVVPWHKALPEKAYKAIEEQQKQYKQEIEKLDLSYLAEVFIPTQQVLDYLQPTKVNIEKYQEYQGYDSTGHIASFKPNEQGFAKIVEYDRTSNVTGRFKTVSGPMMLHLPKIYRSVLTSRFENGRIYSLDYKSLEPRVLLSISGTQPKEEIDNDIYQTIKTKLFNDSDICRDDIKKIVLSELYGAGIDLIRQRLPNVKNVEEIIEQINQYFGLENLKTKLFQEWKANNNKFITNFYGRRVKTETTHTLVNHYVQSTAVDVAMLGFKNILNFVEEIQETQNIVPMFILHDALILDIHPNCFKFINGLCKVGSVDIKNLESVRFYMSADKDFATP